MGVGFFNRSHLQQRQLRSAQLAAEPVRPTTVILEADVVPVHAGDTAEAPVKPAAPQAQPAQPGAQPAQPNQPHYRPHNNGRR